MMVSNQEKSDDVEGQSGSGVKKQEDDDLGKIKVKKPRMYHDVRSKLLPQLRCVSSLNNIPYLLF